MISVLMAVKTGWQYFPEALESLLAQQHVEWELLVGINGHPCNGDVYQQVCKWYTAALPKRCAFVVDMHDVHNKPTALNRMAKLARGSHIAMLDVDDIWHPWKLAKQLAYLREYDVVGTMGEWFGTVNGIADIPCGPITFDDLLERNCLLQSSVILRREDAQWPDTDGLDDYPKWLEMAHQGVRLMNLGGEPLVKIRCHPEQHFAGKRDDSAAIRERFRALAQRGQP